MLYTLLKFLGWGMLLAFIGGCIGWALRSLKGRSELARVSGQSADAGELERLRLRLADLEPVVAERDRLRIQLADVRHADSPGIVGGEIPEAPASEQPIDAKSSNRLDPVTVGEVAGAAPEHDATASPSDHDAAAHGESAELEEVDHSPHGADSTEPDSAVSDDVAEADEHRVLDLDAAARVIGKKVTLDDLTVVEGIGPKICELCSGIGITTWQTLADTDVADLQSMLDAAVSRYAVHKPGTWPRQAALLAAGRWQEFTTVTDEVERGT